MAVLHWFSRARAGKKIRVALALAVAVGAVCAIPAYTSAEVYEQYVVNEDHIVSWSATQLYCSKGFVYPFLHSVSAGKVSPPEGYRESEVEALLASYEESDIPQERKVDLITLQLEAFADLSRIGGLEGIDFEKAYGVYHAIEDESITGNLVTNVFAAGTVDTERCFLTGYANLRDYRTRVNSYAWYLASQGYTVEGSHPSYQWFYNRRNVNEYLGLAQYWFFENYYNAVDPDELAADRLLLPEIASLYRKNRGDEPYFSFNVTYQGHGPYSTDQNDWGETFTDGGFSTETTYIVDNYLASVADTANQLRSFLDDLNTEERPVVVVGYGDHMPWLGNGNSVYGELPINIDVSTQDGFYNYYSTRYFIWANDAAKAALGSDFVGEGETISSCFLMNEVFQALGWQGNSYLQATDEVRKTLSVITTNGRYVENGALTASLSPAGEEALSRFRALEYYEMAHFRYE